jgi:phenylacetic acid degradation protein
MNAVVTDGAIVGESSFIAAAAYLKAGTIIPPRSLVVGVPAKVVRELSDQEIAWKKEATAVYQALAQRSIESMRATEALTTVEPHRKRIPKLPLAPLYRWKQR